MRRYMRDEGKGNWFGNVVVSASIAAVIAGAGGLYVGRYGLPSMPVGASTPEDCPACSGRGRNRCIQCDNGFEITREDCGMCRNKRELDCALCRGTGRLK